MKCLIIIIGESFRLGGQGTRARGTDASYEEQIKACNSHINFIEMLNKNYNMKSISVYISTYTTTYNEDLLKIYNKYLIGCKIYDDLIGLNQLFHNSIKSIHTKNQYDFILYLRIDLFLYKNFYNIFRPNWNTIRFPSICWFKDSKVENHPRVNDMLLFIPKKYYKYLTNINICHETWYQLVENTQLKYDDLDTMINTYHDSDSAKDYNPLYYIVNREKMEKWHSEGYIFDKLTSIK